MTYIRLRLNYLPYTRAVIKIEQEKLQLDFNEEYEDGVKSNFVYKPVYREQDDLIDAVLFLPLYAVMLGVLFYIWDTIRVRDAKKRSKQPVDYQNMFDSKKW